MKLFWAGILAALFCFLLFNIFIWKSDVSKLEKPDPQPTYIYDQNGDIASKISVSNIEGVHIKKIPKDVIYAVIATEDQRFYKHSGVNYIAIIRAFFQNTISGEIVAGGSTVTQQLAKNAFLTQERSYTRKIKELILTKKIERTYSKDEIMEKYLNQIYFGEGAWGIQRAANIYFSKDVSQLTLSESAMLAGLIKAPSILSPFKNMDKAVERRDIVLSLMKKEGYISESEVEKAKNQLIVLKGKKIEDDYKGKFPYYVDHIINEAMEKYQLSKNEILSGGLHIFTELNPTIQNSVEEVYQNDKLFPKSQSDQLIQSGAIFINPKTGGINALVGGRGEHTFLGFNRATQLKRQPGSTMKPLAVYTPALERGYDVFDRLEDRPLNIDGYQPYNYDKQFRGQVTMYDALVHSYNVPPVWLLNKMGLKYGTNAVERFGIPLQEEDHSLGIALGGMSEGTSPLLMAQAYSTFPNNGLMVESHSIQRIEDANGEILGKWQKNATRVTDPEITQKMTYMLKGVVNEGTGVKAHLDDFDVAGKTGTTELPFGNADGAKDHWFVGYTPELVGAIWLGYDKTNESHYLQSSSSGTTTLIFKEILSKSTSELSQKKFDLSLVEKKYKEELQKIKRDEEKKKKENKDNIEEKNKREDKETKEDEKNNREEVKDRKEDEERGKKFKNDDEDD
ncbi:transglycosylase domain-containing protein [Bacillus sp. 03113]|uniref:transglycosylase domain-containing protein n=1 Tax=Bacillus sp. 03113 TaxID=2578211 RepID=UPI0015E884EB|nr:PBP1A family penicillin-binding protein [Bacillus sp. 03113]